ncbi:hypothetical protein [Xylanibacter ruminicola]|uniref:Uncharacterized protein n=1 Tax=Xylanibacter ruminicola TaxID=839 RepID=A0A1M6T604_XYLRU|nr:hypothetical protein [Xylanibacter ruminicola]SHK52178.1 hypothetical protein SAMN05216463_10517 [Xylanibacter ruminicola]
MAEDKINPEQPNVEQPNVEQPQNEQLHDEQLSKVNGGGFLEDLFRVFTGSSE